MIRRGVGFCFILIAIGCFSKATYEVLRPTTTPTYTARGLADLAAHGEPLPPTIILLTTGFSSDPIPRYYPTVPGEPAIVFDRPIVLKPKMVVFVSGRKPIVVSVARPEPP